MQPASLGRQFFALSASCTPLGWSEKVADGRVQFVFSYYILLNGQNLIKANSCIVTTAIEVLPKMMQWFNASIYDYKHPQTVAPAVNLDDDDEEVLQVLNDVEKLIGEPVFIIQ